MFVTNWISTTKIQKISEITNFFRHYFLSRTEVIHYAFLLRKTSSGIVPGSNDSNYMLKKNKFGIWKMKSAHSNSFMLLYINITLIY